MTGKNNKVVVPESFKSDEEMLKFWRGSAKCKNVQNSAGKYSPMSKETAQQAFHANKVDLLIRVDVDNDMELYKALIVRPEYESHRQNVRLLTTRLHPWVNRTGTKA